MCAYIHTSVCTYGYAYTYVYICIYIPTFNITFNKYRNIYEHIYTYMNIYTHMYKHTWYKQRMYAHLSAFSPLHSTARASPALAAYSRRLPVQTHVYLYIIGRIYIHLYMGVHDRSVLQKSPIKETYSAKETYHFKEPTHRSHTIADSRHAGCI